MLAFVSLAAFYFQTLIKRVETWFYRTAWNRINVFVITSFSRNVGPHFVINDHLGLKVLFVIREFFIAEFIL